MTGIAGTALLLSGCTRQINHSTIGTVAHKRLMGSNRGTTTIISEDIAGEIHLGWTGGEISKNKIHKKGIFRGLPMDKLYSEFEEIYSELNIRLQSQDPVNSIPSGEVVTYRSYLELYEQVNLGEDYKINTAKPMEEKEIWSRPRIVDINATE